MIAFVKVAGGKTAFWLHMSFSYDSFVVTEESLPFVAEPRHSI